MSEIRRIPPNRPGTHREAIERTLAEYDVIPALGELARTIADQCDAAPNGPSTRLVTVFLSALKDIQRHGKPKADQHSGKLAQIRARHVPQAAKSPIPNHLGRNGRGA